jgi:hypothetical protein
MNSQYLKIFMAVSLLIISALSWADLTAKVDRSVLDNNETLQFVVRYNGQAITSEPDFTVLQKDFDILSNNRQQQYSWTNGKSQSYTDWNMVLMPKRTGVILIPSISYKNEISNALEITVRSANKITAGAGKQPVYTETVVDKDAVYIQQQIILTQRLYTSVQLQNLTLSELEITDAIVQRVGENQFQKMINGRNYLVIEVIYALFPQVNGKLYIPALRFGAFESGGRQFGAFSSRGKQLFRNTEPKTIDVMAKPTHIPLDQWMPSSKVELQQQWSSDLNDLTVGEPITRTIRIKAQGLTGAQIQPLPASDSLDYKIYPDQPSIEDQVSTGGILGVRTETLALVPNRAGELTLPSITVRWWDTNKQRMQNSTLEPVTLQVGVATTAAPSPQLGLQPSNEPLTLTPLILQTETSEPSSLTKWSMAFNAILLTALIAVLISTRTPSAVAGTDNPVTDSVQLNSKQKLKRVESLAAKDNLMAMRDSILDWGKSLFADNPPSTLKQLAQQLGDDDLGAAFAELDRQLYKGDSSEDRLGDSLDTQQLVRQLKAYSSKLSVESQKEPRGNRLNPLYPQSE